MNLAERIRMKAAESLPTVELYGETYRVRPIRQAEYVDVIDDCMAYARNFTSEQLKGQQPNGMKVKMLTTLLQAQPDISNLLGKVNMDDAYSVAIGHAVIISFAAMQAVRALTTEDGKLAYPEISDRIDIATELIKDEAALQVITSAMEGAPKNESPEA